MDALDVAERSFRLAESLRQENARVQRRIQVLFNGKGGLGTAHKVDLATMTKQQNALKQELTRIKRSTATTSHVLSQRTERHGQEGNMPIENDTKQKPVALFMMNTKSTAHKKKASVRVCQPAQTPDEQCDQINQKRRRSLQHILYENQKAVQAFKKFNEYFPVEEFDPGEAENKLDTREQNSIRANTDNVACTVFVPPTFDVSIGKPRDVNQSNMPGSQDQSDGVLERLDINDARENVTRRLAATEGRPPHSPKPFLATPREAPRNLVPIRNDPTGDHKKVSFEHELHEQKQTGNADNPDTIQVHLESADNPEDKKEHDEDRSAKAKFILPKKQKKKTKTKPAEPLYDTNVYNPDGTLRTIYTMPKFEDSLKEAQRARYIRHKHKPNFEKELTISDIFLKLKPTVTPRP